MVRLQRPSPKKINTKLPKRITTKRKISQISTKPKNTINSTIKKSNQKKVTRIGTCYKNVGCKGKILLRKITKQRCRDIGGKSWSGTGGCQSL